MSERYMDSGSLAFSQLESGIRRGGPENDIDLTEGVIVIILDEATYFCASAHNMRRNSLQKVRKRPP